MDYKEGKILRRIDRKVDQIHEWLKQEHEEWKSTEQLINHITERLRVSTNQLKRTIERVKKCLT